MSRGKRARTQAAIRRKVKRAQKFKAYAQEARSALEEQRDRSRLRAELDASPDVPAAAKPMLGFLIDPHGAAFEMMTREARRRLGEDEKEKL